MLSFREVRTPKGQMYCGVVLEKDQVEKIIQKHSILAISRHRVDWYTPDSPSLLFKEYLKDHQILVQLIQVSLTEFAAICQIH